MHSESSRPQRFFNELSHVNHNAFTCNPLENRSAWTPPSLNTGLKVFLAGKCTDGAALEPSQSNWGNLWDV